MRVCYSTGLVINLNNADERILREKGKLVAKMREWKKAEVILNVVNKVEENEFPEEPGFHIIGEPSDTGPEFITRYKLFFSKENFEKLVLEKDPVVRGAFDTRSTYDRVHISYWNL